MFYQIRVRRQPLPDPFPKAIELYAADTFRAEALAVPFPKAGTGICAHGQRT
jgi:hypothetical protein